MQVNFPSLVSINGNTKENNKNKADLRKAVNVQTNPVVSFAAKTMPAAENLKAYYMANSLISSPKISFGYINKNDNDSKKTPPQDIKLGCNYNNANNHVDFGILSNNAGRVEVWIYQQPHGKEGDYKEVGRIPLDETTEKIDGKDVTKWTASVDRTTIENEKINLKDGAIFYGYRVWGKPGSNWEYKEDWTPGSDKGFTCHVDGEGNRFNPNKLITDPEATEISHDPMTPGLWEDGTAYATGKGTYKIDTARFAPKSIFVLPEIDKEVVPKPNRPLTNDTISECHVKGLTAGLTKDSLLGLYDKFKKWDEYKNDPSVLAKIEKVQKKVKEQWKDEYAGTYKGASFMPLYFKLMGITNVEFLPVQEFQNSNKDNYWGYMTLSYKAPDKQYSSDPKPGGPTREFKEMVKEFHKEDIKVTMDVVYNHTGEGSCYSNDSDKANLYNLRGVDSTSYYETTADHKYYYDNSGCGANLNAANPLAQKLTTDTLEYFADSMGVDAFRFDLASVLGNTRSEEHGYYFDSNNENSLLRKIETKLDKKAQLIAEPWAAMGEGVYQVGNFSAKFAEWNGPARDTFRKAINTGNVTLGNLVDIFAGSSNIFKGTNQRAVNFIDCHDGYTLHDLFSYNNKQNDRFGSDGGTDDEGNHSWNQGGDMIQRKQAVRTALMLLGISAGTPMIQGGDERYRTTLGNNNPWNIDGPLNYIDWNDSKKQPEFNKLRNENLDPPAVSSDEKDELTKFTSRLFNFRKNHPALRPAKYFDSSTITWLNGEAKPLNGEDHEYWNNPNNAVIAFKVDGKKLGDSASAIYSAYNKGTGSFRVALPENAPNKQWYIVADTSSDPNPKLKRENIVSEGKEVPITEDFIICNPRSAVILIEKDKDKTE